MSEKKGKPPEEDIFKDSRFGLIDLDFDDKPKKQPKGKTTIDPRYDPRFAKLDLDTELLPEEKLVEPTMDKPKEKPAIIPAKKSGIQVFLKPRGVHEAQAAQERILMDQIKNPHGSDLVTLERKRETGEDLNRNDLLFLYGLDDLAPKNFSYEYERRIDQLLIGRNTDEDMLVVFECERDQIAHSIAEINENTKAYVGKLDPGIFDKLPESVEHVYTSFPEGRIRSENRWIGGKSKRQYKDLLYENKHFVNAEGASVMESNDFTTLKNPENIKLIRLRIADLGFPNGATIQQIFDRALELGLELCPPEVGPYYRLLYKNQYNNGHLVIGMKPISKSNDRPSVLFVVEHTGNGLSLNGTRVHHTTEGVWSPSIEFMFCRR